jgi:hypothetical protein
VLTIKGEKKAKEEKSDNYYLAERSFRQLRTLHPPARHRRRRQGRGQVRQGRADHRDQSPRPCRPSARSRSRRAEGATAIPVRGVAASPCREKPSCTSIS